MTAIPRLKPGGRIVSNGSGLAGRVPFFGMTAYAMSKSALLSFTLGHGRELGFQGVAVNLVLDGSTDPDANPADGPVAEFQRRMSAGPAANMQATESGWSPMVRR